MLAFAVRVRVKSKCSNALMFIWRVIFLGKLRRADLEL